jgi:hypothetical protein
MVHASTISSAVSAKAHVPTQGQALDKGTFPVLERFRWIGFVGRPNNVIPASHPLES